MSESRKKAKKEVDIEQELKGAILGEEEEELIQKAQKQKASLVTRGRWEIDEASSVRFYKGHRAALTCVDSHPDDMMRGLYTGGKDCCVISWDAETGKKKVIFEGRRKCPSTLGHTGAVTGVAGLWHDNLIVSCGEDGKILVWDERVMDEPVLRVCATTDSFTSLAGVPLSPDEDIAEAVPRVMVGTERGDLQCWMINTGEDAHDIEERKRLWNYYKGHVGRVNQISMTCGNHERVVSCSDDKTTRYHNLSKDTHLLYDRHTAPVESVAQLMNGMVASGDTDGTLHVWSTGSRKPIASVSNLFESDILENKTITALYSPQGGSHTLFAGGPAGEIRVLQTSELKGRQCDITVSQKFTIDTSKGLAGQLLVEDRLLDLGLGTVNAFSSSMNDSNGTGNLVCAMGRDQRLGRWNVEKGAKDGIAIFALKRQTEDEGDEEEL